MPLDVVGVVFDKEEEEEEDVDEVEVEEEGQQHGKPESVNALVMSKVFDRDVNKRGMGLVVLLLSLLLSLLSSREAEEEDDNEEEEEEEEEDEDEEEEEADMRNDEDGERFPLDMMYILSSFYSSLYSLVRRMGRETISCSPRETG